MRLLLLLFGFIGLLSVAKAQDYELFKINYGAGDDALPSSECYEIIQDSKGYIWFGTDRGVVRYNGYEFKTFTTQDGLNNNVVFYIAEGPDGKIWFYDINNQLSYYYEDSIHLYPYNNKLKEFVAKTIIPLGIYIGEDETIYFSLIDHPLDTGKLKSIDKNGEVSFFKPDGCQFIFDKINSEVIICYLSDFKEGLNKVTICYNGQQISLNIQLVSRSNLIKSKAHNNSLYFNYSNRLYVIDERASIKLVHQFDNRIIELEIDKSGNLYVGLRNGGLWILPKGKPKEMYQLISDCSVSGFLMDNSSGMWITTQEKGIYHAPNKAIAQHKPSKNELINHIQGNEKDIIYSTYSGNIFELKGGQPLSLGSIDPTYIWSIAALNGGFRVTAHNYYNYKDINSSPQKVQVGFTDYYVSDSITYGVHRARICVNDKADLTRFRNCYISDSLRFTCIAGGFNSNELLIGTNGNMYAYKDNQLKLTFDEFDSYKSRISDMEMFNDYLLTVTRGNGLIIHKKDSLPYNISKKEGIISNDLDKIYIHQSHIFLLSKEGMSLLNYDGHHFNITNYSIKNGLLSNEVNDVFEREDTVWVATNKGITRFDFSVAAKAEQIIPVYLTGFNVDTIALDFKDVLTLSYDAKNIEIVFEGVSLTNKGYFNYRYKLLGLESDWIQDKSSSVRYPRLPSGAYQFMVSTQNDDGSWNEPVVLVEFKKLKPFWEEVWFILLCILLVSSLVYLGIRKYVKGIKEEHLIKQTIIDLERRALQAQMNPHFIFNSLTSIQSLISQNENDKAQDFLVKFSRLVRTTLNHSLESFVPLDEELELIENYIRVEELRFSAVFAYRISIDEEVDESDIKLPPMIIQPFIENAIEHGLLKLEGNGSLEIAICEKSERLLECVITDNGVGRTASAKIPKRKGRASKGIKLVKDRLSILDKDTSITYVDLMEDNKPSGTKVIIAIPYQNTYL